MDLYLKNRKGFVKIALQTGASIIPVIGFGENEIFDRVDNTLVTLLNHVTSYCGKFAAPVFIGRAFTIIPKRHPLVTVMGPEIHVQRNPNPTHEQVNDLHRHYIECLSRLYEEHKDEYHSYRVQEMQIL
jgi:2-acylglycerol O-acyltransferase 2